MWCACFVDAGLQGIETEHAFAIQTQACDPAFFRLGAFKTIKHEIAQAPDDGLASIQAGALRDVWMAADHPLAAQPEVSLAECAEHDHVVLQADRIEVLMRQVWARHQLKTRAVLKTSSLEAVRSLVGVGAGLAVLPDFLYRPWTLDAEHVEVRTLRDAVPTVDVGLVWRRGSQPRAEVLEFIEVARDQSRSRRPVA